MILRWDIREGIEDDLLGLVEKVGLCLTLNPDGMVDMFFNAPPEMHEAIVGFMRENSADVRAILRTRLIEIPPCPNG